MDSVTLSTRLQMQMSDKWMLNLANEATACSENRQLLTLLC